MHVTLSELARRFNGRIQGDPAHVVRSVAPIESAGPDQITFLGNRKLRRHLSDSSAGVVILADEDAGTWAGNALIVADPYACFAKVAAFLHPPQVQPPGCHPSAQVHADARVEASAWIGPNVVIEAGAYVGARAQIGPGCWIGRDSSIGDDTRLLANVSIYSGCRIGKRGVVHAGAVVGSDGFGFARENDRWLPIPQLGGVRIGDDVCIGANTTIDRGALRDTVIGDGVKLDNLIQIAHNVEVGEHTVMAACCGVAGSARIGRHCALGGRVGVAGHLEIADHVEIAATSLVTHSLRKPGSYSSAMPLDESSTWRRNAARIRQLDDIARRLKQVEREVAELIGSQR
jgi:UDP-3-O-[3-hydroxymyristoyl] glucosamine N-acyltransferase